MRTSQHAGRLSTAAKFVIVMSFFLIAFISNAHIAAAQTFDWSQLAKFFTTTSSNNNNALSPEDVLVPLDVGCNSTRRLNGTCSVNFNLKDILDAYPSYTGVEVLFNHRGRTTLDSHGDAPGENPNSTACVDASSKTALCEWVTVDPNASSDTGWLHGGGGKKYPGKLTYNANSGTVTVYGRASGWGSCGGCTGRVSNVRVLIRGANATQTTPTCSVTADQNPITEGDTTTLRWSSSDSDTSFYINNVGYVTPNESGSATVGPSATTNYSGTAEGPGGTTNCDFTLTVEEVGQCTPTYSCLGDSVVNSCTGESTACAPSEGCYRGICVAACIQNCPAGYTVSGDTCVLTSCPAGAQIIDGQCVLSLNGGNAQNGNCIVGPVCVGDTVVSRNTQCEVSFTEECQYGCSDSACLPVPIPLGSIEARPVLVREGDTTTISWSVSNVDLCTITGSNADGPWHGLANSRVSSPIIESTTFTLSCTGEYGPFTDSVQVRTVPIFQEF